MTKKNGNALNRKIFINSENPRGRRPVTCRIAGKDPQNDNNYHLHVTTCIYAIKPRQIINYDAGGNDSNLLIVFYVQIMPDDFVMQLHRF